MNSVFITGNLTRDVELRYTPSGAAVANFNIANNRKWKDQSGQLKEEVSFLGVVSFGKQAETVSQYFKKGSPILVSGRLKQESWEDRETGKKRDKTVIVMDSFEFMGGKRDDAPAKERVDTSYVDKAKAAPAGEPVEEDDVPF